MLRSLVGSEMCIRDRDDVDAAFEWYSNFRRDFTAGERQSAAQPLKELTRRDRIHPEYGQRRSLADVLEEDPNVNIADKLAGYQLNPILPRDKARWGMAASSGLAGTLGGLGPLGLMFAGPFFPRVAGEVGHGAGRVLGLRQRALDKGHEVLEALPGVGKPVSDFIKSPYFTPTMYQAGHASNHPLNELGDQEEEVFHWTKVPPILPPILQEGMYNMPSPYPPQPVQRPQPIRTRDNLYRR